MSKWMALTENKYLKEKKAELRLISKEGMSLYLDKPFFPYKLFSFKHWAPASVFTTQNLSNNDVERSVKRDLININSASRKMPEWVGKRKIKLLAKALV